MASARKRSSPSAPRFTSIRRAWKTWVAGFDPARPDPRFTSRTSRQLPGRADRRLGALARDAPRHRPRHRLLAVLPGHPDEIPFLVSCSRCLPPWVPSPIRMSRGASNRKENPREGSSSCIDREAQVGDETVDLADPRSRRTSPKVRGNRRGRPRSGRERVRGVRKRCESPRGRGRGRGRGSAARHGRVRGCVRRPEGRVDESGKQRKIYPIL